MQIIFWQSTNSQGAIEYPTGYTEFSVQMFVGNKTLYIAKGIKQSN